MKKIFTQRKIVTDCSDCPAAWHWNNTNSMGDTLTSGCKCTKMGYRLCPCSDIPDWCPLSAATSRHSTK